MERHSHIDVDWQPVLVRPTGLQADGVSHMDSSRTAPRRSMGRAAGVDVLLGTAHAMELEPDASKHARRAVPVKRGGRSAAVSATLAGLARDASDSLHYPWTAQQ